MRKYLSILYFLLIIACYSCNSDAVYQKNYEIEQGIWHYKNKLEFEVNVTDTLSLNDFYISLRNTNDYPYQNLYLYIKTILPNNRIAMDTVECILADDKGKWLGSGLGDIKSNKILFRKELRFVNAGKYLFIIQHGMRKEELEGVIDVGLIIQKSN